MVGVMQKYGKVTQLHPGFMSSCQHGVHWVNSWNTVLCSMFPMDTLWTLHQMPFVTCCSNVPLVNQVSLFLSSSAYTTYRTDWPGLWSISHAIWPSLPASSLTIWFHSIPTLHNRRTELSKSFFNQSVLDKNSCLHYPLPLQRTGFVDKLRSRLQ